MTTAQIVIGIILLVFAVFLIVAVLMQQGKSHNLSGTIAGGAETFFGKSKAQTINKKLSVLTTVVAIVFVLLVGTVYVMQDTGDINGFSWNNFKTTILGSTEKTEDSASVEDEDADTADSADDSADADSAEDSAE
ncbi:MAG: preprotein translocase subunit SecG [Candidatus Avispirillum sp.]